MPRRAWRRRAATAAVAGALAAVAACASGPASAPGASAPPAPFEAALVSRGARLAGVGNCASCHTAPGGRTYAGGRALETPFGTIHGTNITPDPETGIGQWSQADFTRAMREGVDRAGRNLYPVFPYDHFTILTDADLGALYAYLMTRDPVRAATPPNDLHFPYNLRPLISVWKSRYLRRGPFRPDPAQSAEWNRGAYLVEGLAHCGACHTPRTKLGGEEKDRDFTGGEAEGWHAPALNAESPSPVPWTADALYAYLREGLAESHAMTAGPMTAVVHNLAQAPAEDVRAIATYVAALDRRSPAERERARASALAAAGRAKAPEAARAAGHAVYAGACAECHDLGRQVDGGALPLEFATGLTIPTPDNLIRIIRGGIVPEPGERAPWMPAYAGAFSDAQLADLVAYLRSLTDRPAWSDVPAEVRRVAKEER
jgi:mono/diheme cytochrome c family protein